MDSEKSSSKNSPAKPKKPRKPIERIPVRVRTTSDPPGLAQLLVRMLSGETSNSGRVWIQFSFDGLPKSVNHQYIHTRFGTRLSPEVHAFRATVRLAMGAKAQQWKPTGVTAAVILMQSPYWITQERMVRQMDADNRIKPIFDAIEHVTGQVDERHWQFHVFKVPSKRERVTVYLFDLGDVVEYYF